MHILCLGNCLSGCRAHARCVRTRGAKFELVHSGILGWMRWLVFFLHHVHLVFTHFYVYDFCVRPTLMPPPPNRLVPHRSSLQRAERI